MTEPTQPLLSRQGYVLLDEGGHVVDASPAARDLLGLGSDPEGTPASEFPPDVREALARRDLPWDQETGASEAAGAAERPLHVDLSRVEAGGFEGYLLAVRAADALGVNRRFEGILEATGDGVYTLDAEGHYTYTNRANAELLDYDQSEMIGTSVGEILDPAAIQRIEEEIRELLEADGPGQFVVEHEVVTADGERVPVENHISLLLDDEDEFLGTAGIVRDVRERKEREARLERYGRIVEAMGDGVYAMDTEGRYTMANDQLLEMNGYDRDAVIGAGPELLHDEEDIERFEAAIRNLMDAPEAFRTVEATLETASGSEIPIEVNLTLLTDEDAEVRGTVGVVRDVTERKERERELEQYETIVETVPVGVAVIDDSGVVVSANGAVADMLGYDHDEFVGGSLERLAADGVIDESVVEDYLETVRDLLGSGTEAVTFDFEATVDGDDHIFETQLAPRPFDDAFRGVVGTLEDVTERRERRQELERYETLLDIMPDTVVVTDTEGVIQDLHGFEGWTGYDRDELIGEHLSKTTPQEKIERAEELVAELFRDDDRQKVTYENMIVTKDGERIPHENHLALLPPDEDGRIPGSISVLRDISERKQHERALEALNATTRELVAADSREAVIDMALETATGVLELPLAGIWLHDEDAEALVPAAYPDHEALSDEPPTFHPGESVAWEAFEAGRAYLYDDLADVEEVHNPETAIRSELVAPLGDHGVLLAGSTEPRSFGEEDRNLAGILGAAVGTALDRLEREREREEQRRELRRQNEQLERFASVLSHDLRNPLNVAHARVKNALKSDDAEGLESADEALSRMNELIEDILTLAREGRVVGETSALALADAADEAWRSIEAPEASLSVESDVTVEADRARLCELFENLFRNAVEHGSPDVEIRVGAIDDAGFYVEDDGPGIPEEGRDRVLEHGVTTSADGTGFGLAIVESIAEAHGWSVEVKEGSDGGARFEFSLASASDGDGA